MMNELAGSQQQSQVWTIKGLGADGPFPELKEKLMLFGQFVGDWEMDACYPQPDGREIPSGTTIRYYEPKIDAWHSIWISPKQGIVQSFVAREEGEEIVLRGETKEGYPEHWIFSEITPASFRWRALES